MFLIRNKLGIFWTLLILWLCLMPGDNLPEPSFFSFVGADKLIHAVLYLILLILVNKGLVNYFKPSYSLDRIVFIAFLYCILIGVGIEFIQSAFIAGRVGDVFDVLANFVGTAAGVLLTRVKLKRKTGIT